MHVRSSRDEPLRIALGNAAGPARHIDERLLEGHLDVVVLFVVVLLRRQRVKKKKKKGAGGVAGIVVCARANPAAELTPPCAG